MALGDGGTNSDGGTGGDGSSGTCVDPGNGTSFDGTMPCQNWGTPQVASAVLTQMNSTLVIAPNLSTNGATGSCLRNNVPLGSTGAMVEVLQVVPSPSGNTAMRLGVGSMTLMIAVRGGQIVAENGSGVVAMRAYSASAMRWWRIRPVGAMVVYETAPDGLTWTNFASTTQAVSNSYSFNVFGQTQLVEATPGTAIFGSANLCPP